MTDFELTRWIWLILAMIFFLAEVFTAGFVLAAFGVGALFAALAAFLGAGLEGQLVAFILVSGLAVAFSRRFADRVAGKQPEGVGIDRVLGKQAVVLETIDPLTASGRVRVDREIWRAQSLDGAAIPIGTVVEVVEVKGTRLMVRALPRLLDAPPPPAA